MARVRTDKSFLDRRASAAIAAALIALLALVGCESGTQEPDAPAAEPVEFGATPTPDADPEPSAAAPRPTGSSGGSIAPDRFPEELPESAEAAIPADFPSDLPIYPDAVPALGMSAQVDGSDRAAVQLLTNDPPSTVAAFYNENLVSNGWEITANESHAGGDSITATNGSIVTVLFFRPSDDGGTDIYQITEGQ